jgi:hypothetical protein
MRGHAFQRVSDRGEFGNRIHSFMYGAALPAAIFIRLHLFATGVLSDDLIHLSFPGGASFQSTMSGGSTAPGNTTGDNMIKTYADLRIPLRVLWRQI